MILSGDILTLAFWLCAGIVVYAYVGYPAVLCVAARVFGKTVRPAAIEDDLLPEVSLLISALNEEAVIEQRIRNALAMDYPRHKLEIVIASDGSTDRTADIVRRFADQGVRLFDYSMRRGKGAVLNSAIRRLRGEIVLLSDANTFTDPDALRSLVKWFVDPDVGVVCGKLVLTDPAAGKNADGLYWKYETFLKVHEARLGALLGSNGAIYAIRRELFQPIPANTIIDDFVIPMLTRARTGCEVVYDVRAVAREETAPDLSAEFRRRTRIGSGAWQAMGTLWPLLSPRYGWLAFALISHKILRWLCPFCLVLALLLNFALSYSPAYRWLLLAQGIFYVGALAGWYAPSSSRAGRAMHLAHMFVSMNAALLLGFFRWALTPQDGMWTRTQRGVELTTMLDVPDSIAGVAGRTLATTDLLIVGLFAAVAVASMWDAWRDAFRIAFTDEECSYVLLAPFVIAWLAWVRRGELRRQTVRGAWAGLLVIAAGWVVYWYGYLHDPVIWRAGAVLTAAGAVVTVIGWNAAVKLAPAFACFAFLIPVDLAGRYRIAAPLQTITAASTQNVCDLLGISVQRDGNLLSVNGIGVTIAEACNGMRMILTLFMVCYVVAFTMPLRNVARAMLLAASPIVAIVSNVVRLVPAIWVFGHASAKAAETFHVVSGWIMTIVAFVLLILGLRFFQWFVRSIAGDEPRPGAWADEPDGAIGLA